MPDAALAVAALVLTVANLALSYRLYERRRTSVDLFSIAITIAVFDAIAIGMVLGSGAAAAIAVTIPMLAYLAKVMRRELR